MLDEDKLLDLIYGGQGAHRYTQDSPVMADVWLRYFQDPRAPADLLITPYDDTTAADLAEALRKRLAGNRTNDEPVRLAYTETAVVARLSYDELLWAVLPLSAWWIKRVTDGKPRGIEDVIETEGSKGPDLPPRNEEDASGRPGPGSQLEWFVDLAGLVAHRAVGSKKNIDKLPARKTLLSSLRKLLGDRDLKTKAPEPLLWTVNLNRPAEPALNESRMTVKADAAERLFKLSAGNITWAVIDTGIDATHPAFARRKTDESLPEPDPKQGYLDDSRVLCTFDFTGLRDLQHPTLEPDEDPPPPDVRDAVKGELKTLEAALKNGRAVQWDLLKPLLAHPHDEDYKPPQNEHGTHVASVLAGDWRVGEAENPGEYASVGICRDLKLYDLRVMDKKGHGDEFSVLAALQFVRYVNSQHDRPVIHGVNLSLSLIHDVRNYASGRTPVCDEAERLVASGVVVVVAAGNKGYEFAANGRGNDGYRTVTITDPGNAASVITVGATHRANPHTYGVSYFSSRGPTGDGRVKPDLVAPGEKIEAAVQGPKLATLDGTSMAAPHVSGAAALIMARHRELIGQPARIKEILCESATDLGREHYFQGAGLVDILRALQAV